MRILKIRFIYLTAFIFLLGCAKGDLTANSLNLPSNSPPVPDPYPQYVLKNIGSDGGFTIFGGINASENLTLQSTSNSTKGLVLLAPAGGTVGIGTSTPDAGSKLHVVGGALRLSQTGTGTSFISESGDPMLASNFNIGHENLNGFTKIFNRFGPGSNSNGISFMTADGVTNILSITNAGNVGIGTAAPNINAAASTATILTIKGSSADGVVELASGAADGNAVSNGAISFATLNNTTPTDKRLAMIRALTDGATANDRGGALTFFTRTNGGGAGGVVAERMRIDNAGNVGIGTATPTNELHISGVASAGELSAIKVENSAASNTANKVGIEFTANSSTSARDVLNITASFTNTTDATRTSLVEFQTANNGVFATAMAIKDGNVGIGNTAPAYKLDVTGDLRITGTPYRTGGDIAWQVPSDARLKDVHSTYDRGLNAILGIDTVKYNYKQGNAVGADPSQEYVGVIAQQVQQVIPEAVKQDKNGYLSLNSSPIFWTILNAVKELYAKIIGHDQAIASVDAKTANLESENAQLKARADKAEKENVAIKSYLCGKDPNAVICK